MSSTMNTTQFLLALGGQSGFRFDNVAVHSCSLDVEGSTAHTYNSANQLVTSTTNGVATNHTYDPWGRLATRTRGAYSASYEWRYGDKLKSVTSNFPGEAASVVTQTFLSVPPHRPKSPLRSVAGMRGWTRRSEGRSWSGDHAIAEVSGCQNLC